MRNSDRRYVLRLVLAAAALPATSVALEVTDSRTTSAGLDVAAAWKRLYSAPAGSEFSWWYSGTVYAHVDGLREFPIVGLHAVRLCRAGIERGSPTLDWRTFGYFSDLERGGHTDYWDNPFTGKRQSLPPRYDEGPGRYRLDSGKDDLPSLQLSADRVRTNRISVTASAVDGLVSLTQIEGTLQGFPGLDGALPSVDGPEVTERQTRLQIVARQTSLDSSAPPLLETRGYFNDVYDALPAWLGFGERLGSALAKGTLRKAAAGESIDPTVWSTLRRLYPRALTGGRVRLAP